MTELAILLQVFYLYGSFGNTYHSTYTCSRMGRKLLKLKGRAGEREKYFLLILHVLKDGKLYYILSPVLIDPCLLVLSITNIKFTVILVAQNYL